MKNHINVTRLVVLIFSLLLTAVKIDAAASETTIDSPAVCTLIRQFQLPANGVSVYAQSLSGSDANGRGGNTLLQWRPQAAMNPASTMKVVTTAAALDLLGPSHRFVTRVYTDGRLSSSEKGKKLLGNLYVKGYGDPSMVSEQLWRLVTDLKNRGIDEVQGDLVGDDTALPSTGWRREFDRGMSSNSANGALSLNYNHIQIWVQPRLAGTAPKIVIDPLVGNYIRIDNFATTVNESVNKLEADFDWRAGSDLVLTVRGKIGTKMSPVLVYRSIPTPGLYYMAAFREMFASVGGKVSGRVRLGAVPSGAELFYEKESEAFLSQILILMNKYSNNFLAEQLIMGMGIQLQTRQGGSANSATVYDLGLRQLQQLMGKISANVNGMVIQNGSGLSRQNRLSAQQLVDLLSWAAVDNRIGAEMQASLSIFGSDGTTKRRPGEGQLGALVRAKTGSLDNVVALAGYAYPEDKAFREPLVFAILINDEAINKENAKAFQNKVMELMLQRLVTR